MVTRIKHRGQNLKTIARDYKCFRKSSLLFSSHHKRMIDMYPEEWVAVYDGKVRAHAHDMDTVLSVIDETRVPRHLTMLRYISKTPGSMIL